MMRHFAIVFFILFSCTFLWSQAPTSPIVFEERIHDFGTIVEKRGKVSHRFFFHNKGKTSVVIDDIYSDCGCIGKVVSKKTISPGAKGEVEITFNPEYKSGFFSKEIVVYSNNRKSYNRLWVQGTVMPSEHPVEDDYPYSFGNSLYLRLKVIAFGYVKPGETKVMELHYANDSNKEMTLSFIREGNTQGLNFSDPGKVAPRGRGMINVSFTMPKSASGDVLIKLTPKLNGTKLSQSLQVKVLNTNKPVNDNGN